MIWLIALVATVLLVLWYRKPTVEGFDSRESSKERIDKARGTIQDALHSVLGNIKRVSKHLNNRSAWSERFKLATMNPNQLARHYLQSMNREDATRT